MADPSSVREAARLDAQLDAALEVTRQRCTSRAVVVPRLGLRAAADPAPDPDCDTHDDMDVDGDDSARHAETPRSPAAVESGDSIRVFVRVRPPNMREGSAPCRDIVRVDASAGTVHLYAEPPRNFAFDGVLGEGSTQQEVFRLVGSSVGETCLEGYNGSIYVYGQTGSGKTYTMQGPVTSVPSMHSDERRGIMCRILDHIFSEIGRLRQSGGGVEYKCKCSYLEIYKEQISDLLQSKDLHDPGSTNLQIREDINRGVYVERLSEHSVWTLSDALHVLWTGLHQRHVGATHMNELSSRSHAVFTLVLEATSTTSGGVTSTRAARLNLIDLAGSERQSFDPHNPALHESLRVKEAGAINRSLSALTNVIMSLSHAGRRRSSTGGNASANNRRHFVRYRDSRLTFLLRDSLGGNSKTVIVACVSPSALCFGETLSTLKFAARAKHIRCVAVMNEEYSGTVESLMLEVKSLKQQLELLSTRGLISGTVNVVSQASLPLAGGSVLHPQRPGGAPGDSEAFDHEDQIIEALINDGSDDLRRLYGPRRIRRLEILLAAALDRERRCELRRHKLDKFTQFLNTLLERKEAYFDALRDYFSHLVDHAFIEGCFLPEVTTSLVVFRQQLSSMSTDGRRIAASLLSGEGEAPVSPGDDHQGFQDRLMVSPSIGELAMRGRSFADPSSRSPSYTLLGGDASLRRSTRRLAKQRSPSSRILKSSADSPSDLAESTSVLPSPVDGVWFADNADDLDDDELMLLRTENRLLRRQLENHPELQRLGAENRLLREHLASLVQQHALSREEPPCPKGHTHQRQAMIGKMGRGGNHSGLIREKSLTRTSKSSILGLRSEGGRETPLSPQDSILSSCPFPGIEDATQISPSTSSADSDSDESDRGAGPVTSVKRSGGTKASGTADATSFLPMMAREVEELLRVKAGLEEDLRQLMRAKTSTAEKGDAPGADPPASPGRRQRGKLQGASQQAQPEAPPATAGGTTDIDTRVAAEILRGTAEALQFAEGMLAKGKGETLLLSSAGAGGASGGGGGHDADDGDEQQALVSPGLRAKSVEGLDERDVFMSLMRSLPNERPALTRQGFASSAPHLSPSSQARSPVNEESARRLSQVGLHRGGHSADTVATMRASSSTGSTNARLMRNRSTLQLHRIAELPLLVASLDMEASMSPAVASTTPANPKSIAGSAPVAVDATDSNEMLKEAAQKVRQLCHHLELVCDAYRDMREQLKPLHEEFFRRLEECKFLEAQCRRLDVHCRLLEERAVAIEGGTGSRAQTLSNLINSGLQDIRLRGKRPSTSSRSQSRGSSPIGTDFGFGSAGASAGARDLSLDLSAASPGSQIISQGIDSPSPLTFGLTSPVPLVGTPQGLIAAKGVAREGQVASSWALPQVGVVRPVGSVNVRGLQQRALSTTALVPQASTQLSFRGAVPEVPPRGLLYAASVQELRLESSPHAPSGGGAAPTPWRSRDYLRRVSSAPQLSVMHSAPGLLGAEQPAPYGVYYDGASNDGQARSSVSGSPTFSSSTFLSLARQPGAKVAALHYLMSTIGESQAPAAGHVATSAAALPGATRVVIPSSSVQGLGGHAAVAGLARVGSKGSTSGLERLAPGFHPAATPLRCAGPSSHASSTASISGVGPAAVVPAAKVAPSPPAGMPVTAASGAASVAHTRQQPSIFAPSRRQGSGGGASRYTKH